MYGGSLKNRRQKPIPLALRLWSSRAPGFKGENDEILNILKSVYEATGGAEHLKHLSKRMGEIPEAAFCAELDGAQTAVRTKAVSRKTK
jgi:hypothetical protein